MVSDLEGQHRTSYFLCMMTSPSGWMKAISTIDLTLFDYAKAFDLVSHPILLKKLSLLGVRSPLIYWIEDFLVGRSMFVSVKGKRSRSFPVASGVPQGSVLGPILFLTFINHIGSNITSGYKIFADDLKMYMTIDHPAGKPGKFLPTVSEGYHHPP